VSSNLRFEAGAHRAALAGALGCAAEWIGIATQEDGFAWREIT
jgi:hypothetical protein